MKKLFLIVPLICLLFASVETKAQRWPFGDANAISVTISTPTTAIADLMKRGINFVTAAVDTGTTITLTNLSSELEVGDLLVFKFTGDAAGTDVMTYSTGLTGQTDSVPATKIWIVTFIWDGTTYKKLATTQVN